MSKYDDALRVVADQVIDKMATVGGQWVKSWASVGGLHAQAQNERPYKGLNQFVLLATAAENGWDSARWATYKTWQGLGSQVRKGETGTMLVFWRPATCPEHRNDRDGARTCPDCGGRMIPSVFTVFAAEQCDHDTWQAPTEFGGNPDAVRDDCDEFVDALGVDLRHGGDRAYFSPSGDYVQMPRFEQFHSAEGYYSTLFHELTHWSGADGRLGRITPAAFGSEGYAYEELVAELGAIFLSAEYGVEPEMRDDHVLYLKGWISALKDDPKMLYKAASDASAAAEFLENTAQAGREARTQVAA